MSNENIKMPSTKATKDLKILLKKLKEEERLILKEAVQIVYDQARTKCIDDIWHDQNFSSSFWILLMNGINNSFEANVANKLLLWREFFAGPSAQVRCLQSSERDLFNFCMKEFDVISTPVLIFSDDILFNRFIKIDDQLIHELMDKPNGAQNFFTKIHSLIERGYDLSDINKMLRNERFWKIFKLYTAKLKVVYQLV